MFCVGFVLRVRKYSPSNSNDIFPRNLGRLLDHHFLVSNYFRETSAKISSGNMIWKVRFCRNTGRETGEEDVWMKGECMK
jgi:hypothetical protein